MFITILILFIVTLYLVCRWVYYGPNGYIHKIPGPSGFPIIGNVMMALGTPEKQWKLLLTLTNNYYPILKVWFFAIFVVSIRHPDDLEKILSSTQHINKSKIYDILHPWLDMGLLTSGGSKWHSRRKILTPAFHFNILQQFVEVLIEEGERMTESLKNTRNTVVKDLVPFISKNTLNALCETTMGISLDGMASFQEKYRNAIHLTGQIMMYRLLRPWLRNDWVFSLTTKGREQASVLKILHQFTEKVIADRKAYHRHTNGHYLRNLSNTDAETVADDVESVRYRKKRLALMDLLILASQDGTLTDLDIREEVDTFMFEGHDTVAMGITFALALLAEHRDIQDNVRKEVDAVMKENEGKLTMKSLHDLQYLDRCIKEALRLYPSVYFISRVTSEEVQLQSYTIPAETIVHLHIYGVHRDSNFWPNPEIFDPDRFLPEKIRNRHPYSYLPFSAGPRNCIGQRFALLEMKAMIAPLVHNFYLEPVDYLKDVQIRIDLVLRPIHPHRIKFIPIATK